MPIDLTKLAVSLLITLVVGFLLYRRVRANLGRQRLRATILVLRIILFVLACGVVLASPATTRTGLAYAVTGALLGAGLSAYALRHTKFEITPEGKFYTPHLYIGLAVTGLLLARVAYRFMLIGQNMAPMAERGALAASFNNPLTMGMLFLTIGYYLCYFIGILANARQLRPAGDGGS